MPSYYKLSLRDIVMMKMGLTNLKKNTLIIFEIQNLMIIALSRNFEDLSKNFRSKFVSQDKSMSKNERQIIFNIYSYQ